MNTKPTTPPVLFDGSIDASAWPDAQLPAAAAHSVDPEQFFTTELLAALGDEADRLGLRATGADDTERYIHTYADRLRRAGLHDVHLEPVPMRRWLADSWSLTVAGQTLENTFYAPYTKATGPSGVTAPTVYVPVGDVSDPSGLAAAVSAADVAGKIAVFEVPYTALPLSAFAALSYSGAFSFPPGDPRTVEDNYRRPWLNGAGVVLELLHAAGAVGTVGIWPDLPGEWARQYTPYDGTFRSVPGLWIDRDGGARLRELAGTEATLVLEATEQDVLTHNLVGFIPGRSAELTVLHTHTDGTNGMEENGQIGILAAAQYLARLPQESLQRTVMVFLSTGHFLGGVGIRAWLESHADDLVPRVSSILTLEHLGCLEWLPASDGQIKPSGNPEFGAYFTPNSRAMVAASIAAHARTGIAGTVGGPFLPAPTDHGTPSQPVGWPGEGTYFWWYGGLLTSNFITGPYGLLAADLPTAGMVDYELLRTTAMVAVETVVQLAAADRSDFEATAT